MRRLLLLSAVFLLPASAVAQPSSSSAPPPSAAADAFAKLKTLHGDWIDVDGTFGEQGKVAVTYRVTGGGNAVVETFPAGTANEMVTVYHVDGRKLVLTHYCTSNTQPRMTSNTRVATTSIRRRPATCTARRSSSSPRTSSRPPGSTGATANPITRPRSASSVRSHKHEGHKGHEGNRSNQT
jgi:hypothetical protein